MNKSTIGLYAFVYVLGVSLMVLPIRQRRLARNYDGNSNPFNEEEDINIFMQSVQDGMCTFHSDDENASDRDIVCDAYWYDETLSSCDCPVLLAFQYESYEFEVESRIKAICPSELSPESCCDLLSTMQCSRYIGTSMEDYEHGEPPSYYCGPSSNWNTAINNKLCTNEDPCSFSLNKPFGCMRLPRGGDGATLEFQFYGFSVAEYKELPSRATRLDEFTAVALSIIGMIMVIVLIVVAIYKKRMGLPVGVSLLFCTAGLVLVVHGIGNNIDWQRYLRGKEHVIMGRLLSIAAQRTGVLPNCTRRFLRTSGVTMVQ